MPAQAPIWVLLIVCTMTGLLPVFAAEGLSTARFEWAVCRDAMSAFMYAGGALSMCLYDAFLITTLWLYATGL